MNLAAMVAALHSFAPHHDEEEEEEKKKKKNRKLLTLDRYLTQSNPDKNGISLITQNGQPLYKWPFPPFIDQGGERLIMWDLFPPLLPYPHFLRTCASVAHRRFALFFRVSACGQKSSRQRMYREIV